MSVWDDAVQSVKDLCTVCKSVFGNIYDMVYNSTAKDVTVKYLDSNDQIQTGTIPNWAKMNAQFEAWKGTVQPQIGTALTLGEKASGDITNPGFDGLYWQYIVSHTNSAGYALAPLISVDNGATVRVEIELAAETTGRYLYTRGLLTLSRDSGGNLYSLYTLIASNVGNHLSPGSPVIQEFVGVKDGQGDNSDSIALYWVLDGADYGYLDPEDLPALTNFYGRFRVLDQDFLA